MKRVFSQVNAAKKKCCVKNSLYLNALLFQVARVTPNTLSYDAHHVISGHEYFFRVSAENDFGKSDPCVTNIAVRAISPNGENLMTFH